MADGTRLKQLEDFTKKLSLDLQGLREEVHSIQSVKGDMKTMKTDIDNQLQLLQPSMDQKFQLLLDRPVFPQRNNQGGETHRPWKEGEVHESSTSNTFTGYQPLQHQRIIQTHQMGEEGAHGNSVLGWQIRCLVPILPNSKLFFWLGDRSVSWTGLLGINKSFLPDLILGVRH